MNTRRITKVIIGLIVIGSATAYLLDKAIESSWAYYYSVDEFVESEFYKMVQSDDTATSGMDDNRNIRLAGRIRINSVVKTIEKMQLDFEMAGQKSSVPVRFYGVVPRNFTEGKEVIVEGKAGSDGVFQAETILTRCESKYKVKLQTDLTDKKSINKE